MRHPLSRRLRTLRRQPTPEPPVIVIDPDTDRDRDRDPGADTDADDDTRGAFDFRFDPDAGYPSDPLPSAPVESVYGGNGECGCGPHCRLGDSYIETLVFPDRALLCHEYQENGVCGNARCRRVHGEGSSLTRLMAYFAQATRSIDICVYLITCDEVSVYVLCGCFVFYLSDAEICVCLLLLCRSSRRSRR